MNIAVIQASSQSDKHEVLLRETQRAAKAHEVIRFGCGEGEAFSYVEIALLAGLLLSSRAVDFVVTGCSSGQGMMLACNSVPGVMCGYAPTPQDAYLFAQINAGNAVSVPLGLGYGWCGELNLRYTLSALFEQPLGGGYPPEDAARKQKDTALLKELRTSGQVPVEDFYSSLDRELVHKLLQKRDVIDFVLAHGKELPITEWLREVSKLDKTVTKA